MASAQSRNFEQIFKGLFNPLCGYAVRFTGDLDAARNIVHDVFIQLWDKFDSLPADSNYKSYCYKAVRNRCLNHIRDKKKFVSLEHAPQRGEENATMEANELAEKIEAAMVSLPPRCREIFELNRIEGLKYAEIAARLNLSVKTVEAQMTKAIAIMRDRLSEFLTLLFILMT